MLTVDDVSKSFLGQQALDHVSLSVEPGEVHALLGHNGSGKSTLIKVLAGFHEPDAGSGPVRVGEHLVRPGDPDSARRAGLRFIHQELGLVDGLTVLENLRLGSGMYETGFGWRIRWRRERAEVRRLLERLELDVSPDTAFGDLSPVQRTEVAIARCIQDEEQARILVFDEPTATLPNREVERLFTVVRRLVARELGVLYVTHRLEEVAELAGRVTVLRDGAVVGSGAIADFPRSRLVSLIIGGSGAAAHPAGGVATASTETALEVNDVDGGELHGLSLILRRGDVLGVAGLAGSGVNDLPAVMCGRVPLRGGAVVIPGVGDLALTPHALRRHGVAVLLAARHLKSIQTMSVTENLTLAVLRRFFRGGFFRHAAERRYARELVARFGIRPHNPERTMATLSGGNQQKVCVARSLTREPSVLILDEPTQGVDVGGKQEIIQLLHRAAEAGRGVMLCSSDLSDLASACRRVIVVRDGRVAIELTGAEITRERITAECYGAVDGA